MVELWERCGVWRGVVRVEQREGPVVWEWRRTLATLITVASILLWLSVSWKLAMNVAIHPQMPSRGWSSPSRSPHGSRGPT